LSVHVHVHDCWDGHVFTIPRGLGSLEFVKSAEKGSFNGRQITQDLFRQVACEGSGFDYEQNMAALKADRCWQERRAN
jgi:hypothetical protein